MPIEVKDGVEWTETEKFVSLKVPLKGASTKNVDIFSTNRYLKISFPPYIYELAFHGEINDDASKATITDAYAIFHLEKTEERLWLQLESHDHKDKEFMKQLRGNAAKYKEHKEKEKKSQIIKQKDENKKFAVKEQIKLDGEQRKQIESSKKLISEEVTKYVNDWKKPESNSTASLKKESDFIDLKPIIVSEATPNSKNGSKNSTKIPNPRNQGSIKIEFTKRILPTPARESKLPEEEIWLQKIAEMNKMKQATNDALDIEEMNPIWLKDKGDEFFKKQNFIAAINAYTSALLLDSKIPMIYSNRGACHLALKQYAECVQDCTCALEYYDPPVEANIKSRCRAYTRRGTAYYHLENYIDALNDYQCAVKLDPQNTALKADAYKIRRIIQGIESSD